MQKISMVITNGGDGSNSIDWVTDQEVLDRMDELANEGDESYASGDGLQVHELVFPEGFDLQAWMKTNHISPTMLSDLDY